MARRSSGRRIVLWLVIAASVLLIARSAWTETLAPLVRRGEWSAVVLQATGIFLALVGAGIMVYGGYAFVQSTMQLWLSSAFQRNIQKVRSKRGDVREARWANWRTLWRTWHPHIPWLFLGFALVAAGGVTMNWGAPETGLRALLGAASLGAFAALRATLPRGKKR